MGIRTGIMEQFGHPRGVLGRLVGWVMSVSNRRLSEWVFQKVRPRSNHFILEVGYGPGIAFQLVAQRLKDGLLVGVDHSQLMYRMARKRNRLYVKGRIAVIRKGTVDDINYPDCFFDTVFGNNIHFFWVDPSIEFSKLRRLLKPGGKLVIVFQPRWIKNRDELKRMAKATERQFREAGFINTLVDFKRMRPVDAISVTGFVPPVA